MLSNSCLEMRDQPQENVESAIFVFTQLVSDGPVETHVFQSLQSGIPILVLGANNDFQVVGAEIKQAPKKPR